MKRITLLSAILVATSALSNETEALTAVEKFVANSLTTSESLSTGHMNDSSINKTQGSIATVGIDVTCDYQSQPIQAAIDDGETLIRVVAGTYSENLNLGDGDITLEGGYENCSKAANDDLSGGGTSIINGSSSPDTPTITIPTSDTQDTVNISRFDIRGGGGSGLLLGGGILIFNSPSDINLTDLNISANRADFGGGVSVFLGTPNIFMQDVLVLNNTADSFGGGIYCAANNQAQITFTDTGDPTTGGIFNNRANDGNGGGVFLGDGCVMNFYSGQDPDSLFDVRGILSNRASEHGGGVSVENGSTFNAAGFQFIGGNNTSPVSIINNTANSNDNGIGNGGAVYVNGEDSIANLWNVNVANNSAYNGGAVSVENGAKFETESINQFFTAVFPCWNPGKCNIFSRNEATNNGGTFFATQDSALGTDIKVFSSHIYDNEAEKVGAVSYITGAETEIFMEGSMIYNNTGAQTLYNFTDTVATYQYSTIADNINTTGLSLVRNFQGTIQLRGSIVHNLDDTDVYSTSSPNFESLDCLITHENSSFTGNMSTQVADPQFIDRANEDYHINAFLSPAVDYCDGGAYPPEKPSDIDYELRGWDDYIAANEFGPYDIGADETYQNDVIFEDGLEN